MFPDRRQLAAVYTEELTSLGDDCTTDEALALTPAQCVHRLWVARRAAHARAEVASLDERTPRGAGRIAGGGGVSASAVGAILCIVFLLFVWGMILGHDIAMSPSGHVRGYCAALALKPARHGDRWICIDPSKFAEVKP